MKQCAIFFIVTAFTLAGSAGCNPAKAPEKAAASRYDSIAVLPITGENGGLSKEFLERELPEAVARVIARKRPGESLRVIAPAIVQERRKPEMELKELGKILEAKTLLIGKTNGFNNIDFQLIVADTGELLWGEAVNTQNRDQLAATVADQVLKHLTGEQKK